MNLRRRGTRLLALLISLVFIGALSACMGGAKTKPPMGTTATTGPVIVTTNLGAYTVNDAIGVTVVNTTSTDYFAISGKSACVIIQLERYNATRGVWEAVDSCAPHGSAQVFTIAKNSKQQFTLAPNSSSDPNAWESGLYRVTVTYSTNTDGVTNIQQAHCAAFEIS